MKTKNDNFNKFVAQFTISDDLIPVTDVNEFKNHNDIYQSDLIFKNRKYFSYRDFFFRNSSSTTPSTLETMLEVEVCKISSAIHVVSSQKQLLQTCLIC